MEFAEIGFGTDFELVELNKFFMGESSFFGELNDEVGGENEDAGGVNWPEFRTVGEFMGVVLDMLPFLDEIAVGDDVGNGAVDVDGGGSDGGAGKPETGESNVSERSDCVEPFLRCDFSSDRINKPSKVVDYMPVKESK